jgi:hypothetical protein
MGKGRFINQKLGKNVSRKAGLLKSELVSSRGGESSFRLSNSPVLKKGTSSARPQ